ncbi:MAG: transporter substrate-binding domain-containing protein [Pseudomonadota bacterium]
MTSEFSDILAPTGTLRVGINMANMLLVTATDAQGQPQGIAPDLAKRIAHRLGVPLNLVPMPQPGHVADAIGTEVDIGLIAREPERAETVAFTRPYAEIEATYLIAPDSPITQIDEVDQPGREIAVADRAAYDLYLKRSLAHARLVRADGLGAAFEMFRDRGMEVLAGLRPALLKNAEAYPGARVLEGRYTTIEQAVGMRPGAPEALAFLQEIVAGALTSGFVADAIDRHGVKGKLTPASP